MKLLIWDFDGTLGYREGGWSGALLEVLVATGLVWGVTRGDLRTSLESGFPWHAPDEPRAPVSADVWWERLEPVFARAFVEVGVEKVLASHLAAQVRAAYVARHTWRLYPDTLPALEQLSSQGWQHALLTNHVPELSFILVHLGLGDRFVGVFNSAETGIEKPHARAFHTVLQTLKPETARMIGDNPVADIAGAEAAGLSATLVRNRSVSARPSCADLPTLVRTLADPRV